MLGLTQDERTKFKTMLNDKLEKEIVSFLNAKDNGEIVGINDDLNKIQLDIKNRIKLI